MIVWGRGVVDVVAPSVVFLTLDIDARDLRAQIARLEHAPL
jgi:hypothetical protein